MQKYGNGGEESGIAAFDIGPGSITLEFAGGDRYVYTAESAGPATISTMQVLAQAGKGLSAFLATELRGRYSSKLSADGSASACKPAAAESAPLTNVPVDSELIRKALSSTGMKNKRAIVEEGLRTLIRLQAQEELLKMAGTVDWDGDLDAMRTDK
jgi:Arc/MetJ family transcription regulator